LANFVGSTTHLDLENIYLDVCFLINTLKKTLVGAFQPFTFYLVGGKF